MGSEPDQALSAQSWHITRRWQEYEGEIRTAILRVGLVAAFYAVHLLNFCFLISEGESEILFHRQVTAIAAAWLFVSLGVLVSLRQRFFPPALKFITCGFDTMLLTACAALGAGPASALVACYFLIIASSALRMSLPLIWQATITSIAGYLWLVGTVDSSWFDAEHVTPVVKQLMIPLALGGTGIVLGQLVRMISASASEHLQRYQLLAEGSVTHE